MIELSTKAVKYFDKAKATPSLRTHEAFHGEIRQFKKGGSRQWLLVELININIMDKLFYKRDDDNLTFTAVEYMDALNLLSDLTYNKKQYKEVPKPKEYALIIKEQLEDSGEFGQYYRYTYLTWKHDRCEWIVEQTDYPHKLSAHKAEEIPVWAESFKREKKEVEAAFQKEWQTHSPEPIPVPPIQY